MNDNHRPLDDADDADLERAAAQRRKAKAKPAAVRMTASSFANLIVAGVPESQLPALVAELTRRLPPAPELVRRPVSPAVRAAGRVFLAVLRVAANQSTNDPLPTVITPRVRQGLRDFLEALRGTDQDRDAQEGEPS